MVGGRGRGRGEKVVGIECVRKEECKESNRPMREGSGGRGCEKVRGAEVTWTPLPRRRMMPLCQPGFGDQMDTVARVWIWWGWEARLWQRRRFVPCAWSLHCTLRVQSTTSCSEKEQHGAFVPEPHMVPLQAAATVPLAFELYAPSMAATAEKAQHDPHCAWFLTALTMPGVERQSKASGAGSARSGAKVEEAPTRAPARLRPPR